MTLRGIVYSFGVGVALWLFVFLPWSALLCVLAFVLMIVILRVMWIRSINALRQLVRR